MTSGNRAYNIGELRPPLDLHKSYYISTEKDERAGEDSDGSLVCGIANASASNKLAL